MRSRYAILTALVIAISGGRTSAADPHLRAFAGTGEKGYSGDNGQAIKATLNNPFDVALDAAGNLYFSDTFNHCVRKVDAKTGIISTIAGTGKKGYSGDGGPAASATLNEPYGIEVDQDGNLYIVDRLNYCIRRVTKEGKIQTLAGTGKSGFAGDGGPGKDAMFREPNGLCLDGRGKLYIADVADQRVRVLDLASGKIDTFCGDGRKQQTGDGGLFRNASLFGPRAVAMGVDGNLYICEREGNAIRKLDFKSGKIERVAGTGQKGYSGDNGPALRATFNGPKELDIDKDGNIFVVDTENQAIRRIDGKTGTISTVAGCGRLGNTGDEGAAIKATLGRPHGVVAGPDGPALYIGDTLNNKIRIVK